MGLFSPDDFVLMGLAEGGLISCDQLSRLARLPSVRCTPLIPYPSRRTDVVALILSAGSPFSGRDVARDLYRILKQPVHLFQSDNIHGGGDESD